MDLLFAVSNLLLIASTGIQEQSLSTSKGAITKWKMKKRFY